MKTFKVVLMLSGIAVALNLLLSMFSPMYRRHVPYEIEGLLFFGMILLFGAYKASKLYHAGMNRSQFR
jgi:hypothetical protein